MTTDAVARDEVYAALFEVTVEREKLKKKGDKATLSTDLLLGMNDFYWLAGRLSDSSHKHGGSALFGFEIQNCDTVGDLIELYATRIPPPPVAASVANTASKKSGAAAKAAGKGGGK